MSAASRSPIGLASALAGAAAIVLGGCSLLATPSPTNPARTPAPTLTPVFGLTWAIAPAIELPGDAFAVSSNPPIGPAHPNTAGHPGHFPGQAVIDDIAANSDGSRLVAVGYVGIDGNWRAQAWTSTDGLTWTLASIDDRAGSFAVSVVAAPGGTFVAAGRVGREAAAWTSRDGAAWQAAAVGSLVAAGDARPPDLAERMTVVVSTPDGLLAGGSVGAELQTGHRARLWRSRDGRSWLPLPDEPAAFANAEIAAMTVTSHGLVAIGRLGGGPRPQASLAWLASNATDATTWTRIDDPILSQGIAVSLVATPKGLLAVGSDANELEAVAWSSTDGQAWTKAPTEPSRLHSGEKIRMTDVAPTPAGFVAVGNYVGLQYGTGTSWLSQDGLAWTMAPDQPTFGQAEPEAVITWRDRLVIVGSRGAPDNYIPSVWLSPGLP